MPLPAANTSLEPSLMPARHMPIVGIPTCMRTVNERVFHGVNERYTNAVDRRGRVSADVDPCGRVESRYLCAAR